MRLVKFSIIDDFNGYINFNYFPSNFPDQWMEFNDSSVHPIQRQEIAEYSVYMLFYRRRNSTGFRSFHSADYEQSSIKDRLRSATRNRQI